MTSEQNGLKNSNIIVTQPLIKDCETSVSCILLRLPCCFKSILLAYDIVNGPSNIHVIGQSITVT